MVSLGTYLSSKKVLVTLISSVAISLFFKAGIISVSVIIFFIYCVFNSSLSVNQIKVNKILLFPIFLFLLYVLWLIPSPDIKVAINLISRKIPLLLLPLGFLLVNKKISNRDLNIILRLFLLGCLICSIICYTYAIINIIQNKTIIYPNSDQKGSYYFAYDALTESVNLDPIYLSLYCNLAFVIAVATTFIKNRYIKIFLGIYIGIFIIMMASKIGILTFVFINIVLFVKKLKKKKLFHFILILFLFPILYFSGLKLNFLKERFRATIKFDYSDPNGSHWSSTTYRIAIWSSAFEAIRRKPFLGYGTGGGEVALRNIYEERDFKRGLLDSYNPHNEFLSTTLDLGIIGLCFICAMLSYFLINSVNSKNILTICLVLITIFSFSVESILLRQKGIVFFSFFFSLLFWHLASQEKSIQDQSLNS